MSRELDEILRDTEERLVRKCYEVGYLRQAIVIAIKDLEENRTKWAIENLKEALKNAVQPPSV